MSWFDDATWVWIQQSLTWSQYDAFCEWCDKQGMLPPAIMENDELQDAFVIWCDTRGSSYLADDLLREMKERRDDE